MRTSLVVEDPDVEMDLRHPHWMRGRTGEVKTLVVFVSVALLAVGHVVPGV